MNEDYGLYLVTGKREYRGNPSGTEFTARLDPGPEQRAIERGDIVLLRRVTPDLDPGSYVFPDGWLTRLSAANGGPHEGPLSLKEEG